MQVPTPTIDSCSQRLPLMLRRANGVLSHQTSATRRSNRPSCKNLSRFLKENCGHGQRSGACRLAGGEVT